MSIPTMKVPVPKAEELDLDKFCPIGSTFDGLLAERQEIKKLLDELEKRVEEIDEQTAPALDLAGVKNVVWKDFLVSRREVSQGRRTLNAAKLIAAGVTPLQLEAGYNIGKPVKGGLTVRPLTNLNKETEE